MDREEVGGHGSPYLCSVGGGALPKGVAAKAPVSNGKSILLALGKWLCEGNISL